MRKVILAAAALFGIAAVATPASAQRWGIFVGLWAPTFVELGNALRIDER